MQVHGRNEMQYTAPMDGSASPSAETRTRVRAVLAHHAQLGIEVTTLEDRSDLYEAGMTSRASVSVMLALESEFDIEFPDTMLRRDVFQSIDAIGAAIEQILAAR
jgi:acyl carrier protein